MKIAFRKHSAILPNFYEHCIWLRPLHVPLVQYFIHTYIYVTPTWVKKKKKKYVTLLYIYKKKLKIEHPFLWFSSQVNLYKTIVTPNVYDLTHSPIFMKLIWIPNLLKLKHYPEVSKPKVVAGSTLTFLFWDSFFWSLPFLNQQPKTNHWTKY